ncbi:MAG: glycosyltransferase family 39 protein [Deltaproteobacteria bacterium]|nr:glycosyltransferase family 39 protein [Deltaproteobacteria bacterium]
MTATTATAPRSSDPEPSQDPAGALASAQGSTGSSGDAIDIPLLAALEDKPVWRRPLHEGRVRLLVFLAACAIFLPNLGAFGLWDPWETHYGAVTTEMLETYDWVSPWWGYRQKIGDETQGEPFYSKPVFIFWTEAIASRVIGRGEWSIRLPCALLAIMAVYLTYIAGSLVWGRRTGLAAAGVLATSPFFYMVSRQAQADMPFVATLTLAMMFFMLALFAPRIPMSDRRFRFWTWVTLGFVLLNTVPQYLLLVSDYSFPSTGSVPGFPSGIMHSGAFQALIYFVILGIVGARIAYCFFNERKLDRRAQAEAGLTGVSDAFKDRWLRKYCLFAFYVLVAHATYAKGLLGFGLPGAIILLWLIVTWNWRVLRQAEIGRGILIFIAVGFPWYAGMIIKHGLPYWNRFFIHDHFNRLSGGVHQIDSGTFEHFIKWLGIGLFPWVAFVPLALLWLFRLRVRDNRHQNQMLVMLGVWAAVAFTLFTISSTKFHHYIFPAVPAMAFIVALFLRHIFKEGGWTLRFAALVGVIMFVAVGWDINSDQQSLRNLMTYKYDRPMPENLPIDADAKVSESSEKTWKESYFWKHTSPTLQTILTTKAFRYERFIPTILIIGCLMFCLFFFVKTRIAGLVGLGLTASALSAWALSYYLPALTPHWSQKYLFDAYYDTCKQLPESDYVKDAYEPLVKDIGLGFIGDYFRSEPKRICEEDILAWLITWRGETYYSYNELKPIGKKEQFMPYMETMNGGRKFYVITEKGKQSSIKSEAKAASDALKAKGVEGFADIKDWDVKVENDESMFFQTVSATPIRE